MIKAQGYVWNEITKDYANRDECVAAARHYRDKDCRHSETRICRKKNGTYVVVQRTITRD